MRAAKTPPFFYWFVLPAVALGLVFLAAMVALFQYSFREYIPGSIAVGGFTFGNFARMAKWLYARVFLDTPDLFGADRVLQPHPRLPARLRARALALGRC